VTAGELFVVVGAPGAGEVLNRPAAIAESLRLARPTLTQRGFTLRGNANVAVERAGTARAGGSDHMASSRLAVRRRAVGYLAR
jgi:hypothetical protein